MTTTVSDEQIISALMTNATYKDTALSVGIAERTLYERMNNREFKEKYKNAKSDLVRRAIFEINRQIGSAVDTVIEIMTDKNVNPAIRLQAAQTLLNNSNRFTDRLNFEEKSLFEQQREKLPKYL